MNGASQPAGEQPCGCCTGLTQETPETISNRPALPSIAYRAGRYATFRASLLAALSDSSHPALSPLRTRDTTDFSIAVLDAWAVVLDILTFYQERFANEAFLRTAVAQRSVFELAALVGYEPSPGVAASTTLAFTLSTARGSPDSVRIPAGTRVQSIPGPGQTPQVFETSADLPAVIAWNALPAQTASAWQVTGSDTSTWITGTTNNISPGDALLFVTAQGGQPSPKGPGDVHYVTAVTVDPASGNTQISWDGPLSTAFKFPATAQDMCLYAFRKKAALYGAQAPNPLTLSGSGISSVTGYPSPLGSRWKYKYDGGGQINLDAAYPGLNPPAASSGAPPQWIILTGAGDTAFFQVTNATETSPDYYTVTAKTTRLTLALGQVLTGDTTRGVDAMLGKFVVNTPDITAYVRSAQLTPATLPLTAWDCDTAYPRQPGMLAPVSGTTVTVTGGQEIAANQPIGVSGKRLRLQVQPGSNAIFVPDGSSAQVSATDEQVFLTNSFPPATDPSGNGNVTWSVTTLSGVSGALTIPPTAEPATRLLPPVKDDPVVGEAAVVQSAEPQGDVTLLTLVSGLTRIYDVDTLRVNANAVLATNGETVHEILGSGDSASDSLRFTLKQAPLTYVPATAAPGTKSTLQVWVNNLQWHETGNLLAAGPADRVFVTSVTATGNTVVQFGNGVQGARTPTGVSNIRAAYRKGIGLSGAVNAGQLAQPLDRPQGLSSVTNPGAATGAADAASADQVRARAPLPTLTIGRVVSLADYQNYALGFAGIAKALATWTWFNNVRGVFLTVAGEGGTTLSADDPVVTALIAAIRQSGDPHVPLRVASYVPVLFTVTASVAIDQANYAPDQVLAEVWRDLAAAYSFGQRQLGQSVAASEIIEITQRVAGVTAVRLAALARSGQPDQDQDHAPPPAMLCASGPAPPAGAQLLQLDPAARSTIGVWS